MVSTPLANRFLTIGLLSIASSVLSHANEPAFDSQQLEFFETKVRPLLADHCYECHSVDAERIEASLLLDSREAHLKGGDSGEVLVPGDADGSLLIEAVRYESYEMPPKGKLPRSDIEVLVKWINMGAPWPKEATPTKAGAIEEFDLQKRKSEHWVWKPVEDPALPKTQSSEWPTDELDHFVLAKLEKANLQPAKRADGLALLRRLYMDLIGLPPTIQQIREYTEDRSGKGS